MVLIVPSPAWFACTSHVQQFQQSHGYGLTGASQQFDDDIFNTHVPPGLASDSGART